MADFALEIQQCYGVELPFFNGSFEDAKREAQHSVRYLLIYLHSPTHEDTHAFVTTTLAHPDVRDLLSSRFVFFGASVMDPAGHRLALDLQATAFPFLAVVHRRSPVVRLKGFFAAAAVVRHFQDLFDRLDGVLGEELQLRQEREAKERARLEEDRRAREIESVDRERLRRFDEAERLRREAAERQRREAAESAEAAEALAARRAQSHARREAAAARLTAEPPAEHPTEQIAHVSLRRPCGSQVQRRFCRDEPVAVLHDWALVVGESEGDFQLVAGYPPRPLPCEGTIGDVPELVPRAAVSSAEEENEKDPSDGMVRFQPWSLAVQTRFKWRHKETDRWRRLMDATCFPVDWIGQTSGPSFTQYGGHWSHLLTCAHVICPWDYPNFYPTEGPTRFVSRITLADTMTQVRLVSQQGDAVYKHFTSNQHVYVHSNPRLDLCVLHAEQNFKRSGEMKMMWMQNEGYVMRPRIELLESLNVGDHVWIYGMTAHESLFDEEKGPEPLMVPNGVRAKVHALTREHFFLDTTSIEGEERGRIGMGMCGSVVMRNGRCVGMLTATVHEESKCRELAGTAMCTYASDIFDFLLEVERQMRSAPPSLQREETVFQQRRRDEGVETPPSRDWELDQSRLARHIPVPSSLWHMEEKWVTEEDYMTSAVFGRSGPLNQETQESSLGYDMNSAKTHGERPGDMAAFSTATQDGRPGMQGQRPDHSPTGVYADHEDFKTSDIWDYNISSEMRSLFDKTVDAKDAHSLNMMRKSIENIRAQRAMEKMRETVLRNPGRGEDPLNVGRMGRYDVNSDTGAAAFRADECDDRETDERTNFENETRGEADGARTTGAEAEAAMKRQKETEYHESLRLRHGRKARPFGDDVLSGLWERH